MVLQLFIVNTYAGLNSVWTSSQLKLSPTGVKVPPVEGMALEPILVHWACELRAPEIYRTTGGAPQRPRRRTHRANR
jgi:hypothetical protein